jgi:hypothetical protein
LPEEPRDGSLRYLDAHLANTPWIRGAPQSGLAACHRVHERADGGVRTRVAGATSRGAAHPSPAEPFAMPSHNGVGLHEHEYRSPVPPRVSQDDPKQPIARPELRTRHRASQRIELLAEGEVLEDQFVMSPAGQRQRANEHKDHLQHASIVSFRRRTKQPSAVRSGCGERQHPGIEPAPRAARPARHGD